MRAPVELEERAREILAERRAAELAQLAAEDEREQAKNGGSHTAQPDDTWAGPAVVTYGASFDPATIPLRRWLLGRRRSIGEVTCDAGPPGTNKSMLMLTDAVAIVTGRKLLADEVHQSGAALFLVGEDARRDFEARLAGILANYHIPAAALADRLHVVYLAEVDSLAYCLAQMVDDMATLNVRMAQWLRDYPDLIAIFVDPIAAWHRLMENSNEALALLSRSLRAIAVQGNRHVGFDHHVTKISMVDVEAHVGNLAALRGASSLGADARWAFTMAKLKPETAIVHGIGEDQRKRYRRLDALKASYGPDDEALRLLRIENITIDNGESVGVLIEMDLERSRQEGALREAAAARKAQELLAAALTRMLTERRPRSAQAAAVWLLTHAPELFPSQRSGSGGTLTETTIRARLPNLVGEGLDTTVNGRHARIVVKDPEKAGRGFEIDFLDVPGA